MISRTTPFLVLLLIVLVQFAMRALTLPKLTFYLDTIIVDLLKNKNGQTSIFEGILVPSAIGQQPFFVIQGTLGEIVIEGWPKAGPCKLHTENGKGCNS